MLVVTMVSIRTTVAIGTLVAACAIAIPGAGATRGDDPVLQKTTINAPPGTPPWLISYAQKHARALDPHTSSITLLLGTNYRIVLRGHFVWKGPLPPGTTEAPTGEVAVIKLDGHSRRVTDFGLQSAHSYNAAIAYGRGRIQIARQSNRLFSIFPTRVGTRPCTIVQSDRSQPKLPATCSTQLRKFRDGRARITFGQTWHAGATLTHTWIVVVSADGKAGRATSKGDHAPQLLPGEKTN
jgi:hypothetical protein